VSYLYGYAPLPGFELTNFEGGPDAFVAARRTAYQHQVVGFDFSTAFGEAFALRGEAAYRRPTGDWAGEYYVARPDVQYVLGIDRTFGTVNVIAQYMGRYVVDWEAEEPSRNLSYDYLVAQGVIPSDDRPEYAAALKEQLAKTNQILFSQRAEVQHMATVRIEWLLAHDTLSISALGMVNFTTQEWLLFPKIAYKLSDAFSATIGGEVFVGPDETLFGLVDEGLSAGYAELKYAF
jgi:hypothetical protein